MDNMAEKLKKRLGEIQDEAKQKIEIAKIEFLENIEGKFFETENSFIKVLDRTDVSLTLLHIKFYDKGNLDIKIMFKEECWYFVEREENPFLNVKKELTKKEFMEKVIAKIVKKIDK